MYNDVIEFWFEELEPKDWFSKNDFLDATIRERFEPTLRDVVSGATSSWRVAPEGRLAEVIVLDQFTRNIFRNSGEAFAYDALALRLASEAIENGDDMRLPVDQRLFLYMPFMHSESAEVHVRAMELFTALGDVGTLKYEREHKKIIDRFGRYPHRNALLGRESTPEEVEFLQDHEGF